MAFHRCRSVDSGGGGAGDDGVFGWGRSLVVSPGAFVSSFSLLLEARDENCLLLFEGCV